MRFYLLLFTRARVWVCTPTGKGWLSREVARSAWTARANKLFARRKQLERLKKTTWTLEGNKLNAWRKQVERLKKKAFRSIKLLLFQSAILAWLRYPGRCPGLCAHWAFSPPGAEKKCFSTDFRHSSPVETWQRKGYAPIGLSARQGLKKECFPRIFAVVVLWERGNERAMHPSGLQPARGWKKSAFRGFSSLLFYKTSSMFPKW